MSRLPKLLVTSCAVFAVAIAAGACGSENISVTPANAAGDLAEGAHLFNQRCSGCHSLSYAAANGSASNVRSSQFNNGPNFNVRCERPVTRVIYAIRNGGFSGAIMPQNIVVGRQADDVARFVATYSGRQAPKIPGSVQCQDEPIGSIPAFASTTAATSTTSTTTSTTATTPAKTSGKSKAKSSSKP